MITEEVFLRDVRAHSMTTLMDNGVYRHLVFKQPAPNSWNMWYELVTWPEHLCISGDMGTWVFSRIEDMFKFFRRGSAGGRISINPGYWAEKCESNARINGGPKVFDAVVYKANILSALENYDIASDDRSAIVEDLESEVFCHDNEFEAMRALADFKCGDFQFSDSHEISGRTYSYHFLWALYAIVWGIQQYDQAKKPAEVSV